MFANSLKGNPADLNQVDIQFYPYIRSKTTMQWGGMNDPFDKNEEKYGLSLELLKFFDKIDYPLSISTKGVFFTEDKRYMDLIERHPHNWHFKISIVTNDELKSRKVDRGCPTVKERLKAIQTLANKGIHVTLRLRPYIIGISDDYPKLITKAHNMGADSVTTEFFCLEQRANEQLIKRYEELSKAAGYDILEFYRKHSTTTGYLRLNYDLKAPIINDMREISHKLGMKFYVSDAHHKEQSDSCCCCGTPPNFKVSKGHFAEALLIAKKRPNKLVSWDDIKDNLEFLVGNVRFYKAAGFNTGSNKKRSERLYQTLSQYVQEIWNTPKNPKSPYKYFSGRLKPVKVDSNGNVIYKYVGA